LAFLLVGTAVLAAPGTASAQLWPWSREDRLQRDIENSHDLESLAMPDATELARRFYTRRLLSLGEKLRQGKEVDSVELQKTLEGMPELKSLLNGRDIKKMNRAQLKDLQDKLEALLPKDIKDSGLLQGIQKMVPGGSIKPPDKNPSPSTSPPQKSSTGDQPAQRPSAPQQGSSGPNATPSRSTGPPPTPPRGEGRDANLTERLNQLKPENEFESDVARGLMHWIQGVDPNLARSQAMRQIVRGLDRSVFSNRNAWNKLGSGAERIRSGWGGLRRGLGLDRLASQIGRHWPRALTPRNLHWPDVRPEINVRPPNVLGGAPAATAGDAWKFVLVIGSLALGAALVWQVLARKSVAAGRRSGQTAWQLGPWPVDPKAVRTREELIRAFEHLALLRLGLQARSYNHQIIASYLRNETRLSGKTRSAAPASAALTVDTQLRREAAQHLAATYEVARYAPPQDPVSEEDILRARRELCLLAGVSHS
jgi:hypothetical protein